MAHNETFGSTATAEDTDSKSEWSTAELTAYTDAALQGDFDSKGNPNYQSYVVGGEQTNSEREQSAAENPAEANVAEASSRVEQARAEGARLGAAGREYIGDKFENGREALHANGKAIARKAIEGGKIALGGASLGAQEMVAQARSAGTNIKQRALGFKQKLHQARLNHAHGKALKEKAAREKASQDEAYASYEDNVAHSTAVEEAYAEKPAQDARKVAEKADAEAVYDNAHRENLNRDWQAAKQEHMDNLHQEAIEENERFDAELREKQEAERKKDQEFKNAYEDAENYLKQFSKVKQENRKDLKAVFEQKFSGKGQDDHIRSAYESAFATFEGKGTKAQALAKRKAEAGRVIKEARREISQKAHNAAERVKESETYITAQSRSKKIGKSIASFAKRFASTAKRSFGAARAGASAARDSFRESTPASASAEAEPTDNE